MKDNTKYSKILDALQELTEDRDIESISVSEIAQKAGIGKGSIYYYFPSKDAILDALVERNYEKPLETAKELAERTQVSSFTRMAMLFQACRNSSSEFRKQRGAEASRDLTEDSKEKAYIHQKYLKHLIAQLKPALTRIIQQGIDMDF